MTLAYLRNEKVGRRTKKYAVFKCENCGKENKIMLSHFISAYRVSDGEIPCRFCGKENYVELDETLKKAMER